MSEYDVRSVRWPAVESTIGVEYHPEQEEVWLYPLLPDGDTLRRGDPLRVSLPGAHSREIQEQAINLIFLRVHLRVTEHGRLAGVFDIIRDQLALNVSITIQNP